MAKRWTNQELQTLSSIGQQLVNAISERSLKSIASKLSTLNLSPVIIQILEGWGEVPDEVKLNAMFIYPQLQNPKYVPCFTREGEFYRLAFVQNNEEQKATIRQDGKILSVNAVSQVEALPENAKTFLGSRLPSLVRILMANSAMEEIQQWWGKPEHLTYQVECPGEIILFDGFGNHLQTTSCNAS